MGNNEQSEIFPGIIGVKPFTNKFFALYKFFASYRGEEEEFFTYKEAKEWVMEKKRLDNSAV